MPFNFFFFGGGWLGGGGGGRVGGGRLFEAGRLLTFPTFRMGAYSRWAPIRGWALNRINTVNGIAKALVSATSA